jgi:DNA-binding SARP family transcriptional activator
VAQLRGLGPVELWAGGRRWDLGPVKQQTVLAVLFMELARTVPIETMIDRLWGSAPPASARASIHSYVARLRHVLHQANPRGESELTVVHRPGGYELRADPDQVDVHRFRRLAEQGRHGGFPDQQRAAVLRDALALWHGEPLTGLPGEWAAHTRDQLRQQRLAVWLALAPVELRLGQVETLVDNLRALREDHPLVEPLVAVLMEALCAAGRSAEALDCYAKARQRIVDDLGAEPGATLRQLHAKILRGEYDESRPAVTVSPPVPAVPAQLPLDVRGFTGRADHLARLDTVAATARSDATAVAIAALSGTAGVGKTALAVHWAHLVRGHFPDGQLYINLRGFDPAGSIMGSAEAIRQFLDALQVPPQRIPVGLDAQACLYRSLLADKRVLIVLDNARDADQVRPLLPGAPGCLVVVTSRNQLSGLVAAQGAHLVTLDVLSTPEAWQLLAARLGAARVTAEPDAVDEIIARCARLPLALTIIAARAAANPTFPLAVLAGELRQARRLDALAGDDATGDVRAVLSWSYHALSDGAARLFRLLGLDTGPELGAPAAASLLGCTEAEVRPLLAELTRANMLTERAPYRYVFHDILRAYAREQAHTVDDDDQRRAAMHRMLDHYLHSASAAALLLNPHLEPTPLGPPRPDIVLADIPDRDAALAWFTAEYPVLLAAIEAAANTEFDIQAWQLAWTLATFLSRRGLWQDLVATHTTALAATLRHGDLAAAARTHRYLAFAHIWLDRNDMADKHLRKARDYYRKLNNPVGEAHTSLNFALIAERKGRYRESLHHAQAAHELYRIAGNRTGEAQALNAVGWCHSLLGDNQQALTCCRQALLLHEELGDQHKLAETWDSIGYAHYNLGEYRQAIVCYQHSLVLFRDLDDRPNEAEILTHLGDAHHALDETLAAHDAWQRSLTILDQLRHPDADAVRAKLTPIHQPQHG